MTTQFIQNQSAPAIESQQSKLLIDETLPNERGEAIYRDPTWEVTVSYDSTFQVLKQLGNRFDGEQIPYKSRKALLEEQLGRRLESIRREEDRQGKEKKLAHWGS